MVYTVGVLYLLSAASVVATALYDATLLQTLTRENGLFESITVLLLLWMGLAGFWARRQFAQSYLRYGVVAFALLCFVAAMEEISWFQHYADFESGAFFEAHNHQGEANLHNLIPAHLFSSIIYSGVYGVFVFIPLFARLHLGIWGRFGRFLPSLHVSLVILYGSSFQAYFYDEFGAWFDMATLFAGMALFGAVVSLRRLWTRALALHALWVVLSCGIFMASYQVFGFFNMQYEIREMFVVLGTLLYAMALERTVQNEGRRRVTGV